MATAAVIDAPLIGAGAKVGATVSPLTPTIGAEVSGLDLDRPLSEDEAAWLRAALLRHKVLFFRDADISHESHVRLGRVFGELEGHPVIPHVDGYPEILRIEGVEGVKLSADTLAPFQAYNKWHTDVTFRQRPSIASVLRARVLPPLGGDTMWADTAAAYAGLPLSLQEWIANLDAEHDIVRSFGGRVSEAKQAELHKAFPPVQHPVVRTHPETGEKVLYVNYTFTTRILGVTEEESDSLLRLLFDRIKVPEYQVVSQFEF